MKLQSTTLLVYRSFCLAQSQGHLVSNKQTEVILIINCLTYCPGFLLACFFLIITPFLLICVSIHDLVLPVMPRPLDFSAARWHLPDSLAAFLYPYFDFHMAKSCLSIKKNILVNQTIREIYIHITAKDNPIICFHD